MIRRSSCFFLDFLRWTAFSIDKYLFIAPCYTTRLFWAHVKRYCLSHSLFVSANEASYLLSSFGRISIGKPCISPGSPGDANHCRWVPGRHVRWWAPVRLWPANYDGRDLCVVRTLHPNDTSACARAHIIYILETLRKDCLLITRHFYTAR